MSRAYMSSPAPGAAGARSESMGSGRLHEKTGRSAQIDFNQALQRSALRCEPGKAADALGTVPFEMAWPAGVLASISTPSQECQPTHRGTAIETGQAIPGPATANGAISTAAPHAPSEALDHEALQHTQNRRHHPNPDPAPVQSLFDRLVKLIDISPTHPQRLWRLTIRLNDDVLSGTQLCIEVLPDRTELRFTPGSASAAFELATVAELWSQRLTARSGRSVSIRVLPEMTNNQSGFFTTPLTGATR